jgi:hypothetical protein
LLTFHRGTVFVIRTCPAGWELEPLKRGSGRQPWFTGRRDADERGARIDEPADQPRTGDAIDLRTLSRGPAKPGNRTACADLTLNPAFEELGADPDRTQFNRDLARDFVSADTVNNNLAVNRQFAQPALQRIHGSGHGGDKQPAHD